MDITFTSDITVRLVQKVGGDEMVVAAAKVSVSGEEAIKFANPESAEDSRGLVNYLMKMRHGSAFEHSSMTFFVHAPLFVWREWQRHRIGFAYCDYGLDADTGMSFNEESGRYKTLDPVFYIPDRERPMMKVDGWKPGRPKFTRCEDGYTFQRLKANLKQSYVFSYEMYLANLALGIDPGLARDCLPVGIYSSCWVTANPRSLMAFLALRTHEPTASYPSYPLWEIELAARQCERIFADGWPLTYQAFCQNGRVAP